MEHVDLPRLPPPPGLSVKSRRLWRSLTTQNRFQEHELAPFGLALTWFDRSDAAWLAAEAATGPARAQCVKESVDAANTALRHWRLLKFTDPSVIPRRPGRPAGENWSPKRRALKAAG